MYSGRIKSRGPRYCPSIEDKIVRFADRDEHQVFLEPEGLDSDLIYPNGLSTSLPEDVQVAFLRSMPGLEDVEIVRPGYAIEYDYVDPRALTHALETKAGAACSSPGRSTAPPATRKRRRRACWPAPTRPCRRSDDLPCACRGPSPISG